MAWVVDGGVEKLGILRSGGAVACGGVEHRHHYVFVAESRQGAVAAWIVAPGSAALRFRAGGLGVWVVLWVCGCWRPLPRSVPLHSGVDGESWYYVRLDPMG